MKVLDYINNFKFDNSDKQIEEVADEINSILDNFDEAVVKRKAKVIPLTGVDIGAYKHVIEVKVSCKTAILVNDGNIAHKIISLLHADVYNIYVYNLSNQILNNNKEAEILIYIK